MRPTLRYACIAAAAVFVMACGHAAAKPPGPVPGTDPVHYAISYVQDQAGDAQANPVNYTQQQASPGGVANQTAQAGFIACWQAYEVAGEVAQPVCDKFFTPPGDVQAPAEPAANDTAKQVVGNVTAGAAELANTTADAVQQIAKDPGNATSQLDRVVQAVKDFVGGVADALVAVVKEVLGGIGNTVIGVVVGAVKVVLGILGGLGLGLANGLRIGVDSLVAAAQGLGRITVGGLDALGGALRTAATAMADASKAVAGAVGTATSAIASAIGAVGSAIAAATGAVGNAIAGAGGAVGKAIGDMAQATVGGLRAAVDGAVAGTRAAIDGVASSVRAVAEAIRSLLGGSHAVPSSGDAARPVTDALPQVQRPGLVDQVTGAVPT